MSLILIGNSIIFPNLSTVNGSQYLKELTSANPNGFILGEGAEELIYGTGLLSFYYQPFHKKYSIFNRNIEDYNPKYFAYPVVYDGIRDKKSEEMIFEKVKSVWDVQLLGEIKLYKYPFVDKYKVTVQIYELMNKTNQFN